MKINIAHFYPELLNLYGDKGNIASLKNRLLWRGIKAEVTEYKLSDDIDFENTDFIFIGGGSDKDQLLVCSRLHEIKDDFKAYVEDNGVVLAVCGGYELLAKSFVIKNETVDGIGILDAYATADSNRLTGDIIIKPDFLHKPVIGFENHSGRMFTNNLKPLGKVLHGNGNSGKDGFEGVIYKNVTATYLHGPLLPKNPHLTDYILSAALKKKYGDIELAPLDDTVEYTANEYMCKRYIK